MPKMQHICYQQGMMQANPGEIVHKDKKFENITYENKHLIGRVFRNCTFSKSSMKGCKFEDSSFDGCTFDDCDISLMKFQDTAFTNITVNNCKAMGIAWSEATNPFSIQFLHSRISYSVFYGKNLRKTKIVHCQADEADFSECNLSQADFGYTDLRGARFSNTDLTKANFAGAKNYYIDPAANKIAKAKFSLPEALSFLQVLDIELVD